MGESVARARKRAPKFAASIFRVLSLRGLCKLIALELRFIGLVEQNP